MLSSLLWFVGAHLEEDGKKGPVDLGPLEQALDGIKIALAELQETDPSGEQDSKSSSSVPESLCLTACCIVQGVAGENTQGKQINKKPTAAVVGGCTVHKLNNAVPLLVVYTIAPRSTTKDTFTYPTHPARSILLQVITLPTQSVPDLHPVIKDIVPCAEGKYLAVCLNWEKNGGELGQSLVVQSEILLYEVTVQSRVLEGQDVVVTSLARTSLSSKSSRDECDMIVKLKDCIAQEAGVASKNGVSLVGLTSSGRLVLLEGVGLACSWIDCQLLTDNGRLTDEIVDFDPCPGRGTILVITKGGSMKRVPLKTKDSRAEGDEKDGLLNSAGMLDYCHDVQCLDETCHLYVCITIGTRKGCLTQIRNLKEMTAISEKSLPFYARAPRSWKEITAEQRDRQVPQHIYRQESESNRNTMMWKFRAKSPSDQQ